MTTWFNLIKFGNQFLRMCDFCMKYMSRVVKVKKYNIKTRNLSKKVSYPFVKMYKKIF